MSPGRDLAHDYDGGWAEGMETGEGFEDHLLGPVDPYDRKDHYTPDPRFATRPGMRWTKGEHPTDQLASDRRGNTIGARIDPSVAAALGQKFATPKIEKPARIPRASQVKEGARRLSKHERDQMEAARRGIPVKELRALRRQAAEAARQRKQTQPKSRQTTAKLPQPRSTKDATSKRGSRKGRPRQERGAARGPVAWAREQRAIADRLAASSGLRPDAPPLPKTILPKRPHNDGPAGVCPSCSGPISATGICSCS
jgi:hypothetical protein